MDLIIELATYFIIYSFLGWLLETVFKSVEQKKFINSGFLQGPFCPIYGIGAIIMFLFLNHFTDNLIILFIIGFVVLSAWEYIVGFLLEKIFKTKYWDYSDKKLNIHGRVCLINSLIWGILGIIFIEIIHPGTQIQINKIPQNILIYINIFIYIYLLVDTIMSIIKLRNINIRLNKFYEFSELIKERLKELKELKEKGSIKQANIENIQNMIEELKEKQSNLVQKLEKQTLNLKKVFPTIKSEKLTNFLNTKIEIKRPKKD